MLLNIEFILKLNYLEFHEKAPLHYFYIPEWIAVFLDSYSVVPIPFIGFRFAGSSGPGTFQEDISNRWVISSMGE